MAFAPDKGNPFPKPATHGDGTGGGNSKNNGSFMPGQISGLANDLSTANGMSVDNAKKYLHDLYSPVSFGGFHYGGGNKGGKKDDTGGGGRLPGDPSKPGLDTPDNGYGPRNRSAQPMTFPLGFGGDMPMQQPAASQPSQIPGQVSPEMLAMIRAYMMRG